MTDYADSVALMGGEAVERAELRRRFGALVRNWVALVNRQNRLNGFIFGYYHVSTVFPVLVVTPAYLVGAIPLGVLMQASLAFQKVESAFAFCITSYAKIAEWRAVMNRVAQFEAAMGEVDRPGLPGAALDIASSAGDDLSIKDLVLRLPTGEPIASVPALDLAPADRLLVSGPSGAGKSSLFRGLAGTWPLGDGRIRFPQGARVLALPQRPYFPLGTLRQAMTYPMLAEDGRRCAGARGHGGCGARPSRRAPRRGGRMEHGAFRRRAAAGRLRARAHPPADHPAARRGGLDAGGSRRRASSTACWRRSCPTPSSSRPAARPRSPTCTTAPCEMTGSPVAGRRATPVLAPVPA